MVKPQSNSKSFLAFLKILFKFALVSKFGLIVLLLVCVIPFSAFEAHVVDVTATVERRHCNKFDVYKIEHWIKYVQELDYSKKIGGVQIENREQMALIFNYSGDSILEKIKQQLLALKMNADTKGVASAFVPGESTRVSDLIIEADVLIADTTTIPEEVGQEIYKRILSVNNAGSVSTCETCPTGLSMIKGFDFLVNGSDVPITSLRDSINPGDTVRANFTLAPGCEKQEFSLVAYTAPSSKFDPEVANLERVFDSKTGFFDGGRNSLEVRVPSCAFDIAFVKGAVIEKLGPAGSDNFYSPQGRLIDGDSGDEGVKVCLDPVDLGDDSKIQSATMMDTLGEAEENKPEEKIEEKVESTEVEDEKNLEDKKIDADGEKVDIEKNEIPEESVIDSNPSNDSTTKEPTPSEVVAPSAPVEVSSPVEQEPTPSEAVVETTPTAPQE